MSQQNIDNYNDWLDSDTGKSFKQVTQEELIPALNDLKKGVGSKYTFDTIADAQSSTWLVEGDIIEVLGYYSKNDGAGHKRVYSLTDDGSGIPCGIGFLNISENEIDSSHWGIKLNDTSKDWARPIQEFWDYCATNNRKATLGKVNGGIDKFISIGSHLTIPEGADITFYSFVKLFRNTKLGGIVGSGRFLNQFVDETGYEIPLVFVRDNGNFIVRNVMIDGNNIGYPTNDGSGENGLGAGGGENTKFIGGIIKNCRRGNSSFTGSGGRAVNFEHMGKNNIATGLTIENCSAVVHYNGNPNYSGNGYFGDIVARNCEKIIEVNMPYSRPDYFMDSCLNINGLIAYDCGKSERAGDLSCLIAGHLFTGVNVSNLTVVNSDDYVELDSILAVDGITSSTIDVVFKGKTKNAIKFSKNNIEYSDNADVRLNKIKIKLYGTISNKIIDVDTLTHSNSMSGNNYEIYNFTSNAVTICDGNVANAVDVLEYEFQGKKECNQLIRFATRTGVLDNIKQLANGVIQLNDLNVSSSSSSIPISNGNSGKPFYFYISNSAGNLLGTYRFEGNKTIFPLDTNVPAESGGLYRDSNGFVKIKI